MGFADPVLERVGQVFRMTDMTQRVGPGFRRCSSEELEVFVREYPHPLAVSLVGYCDPPMRVYCDFSSGKIWPEACVARIVLNSERDDGPDECEIRDASS